MTTVYFVRHGTTDYNRNERFQGSVDIPLNELGRAQAGYLAERFRDIPLDAVYCSPLIRARETAAGVCKYHPALTPILDAELCEINGGIFEGQPVRELTARYPEAMHAFRHVPASFAPPEGETARQVHDRVCAAVCRVLDANPGKTVAVVSHGFALLTYLGALERPFEQLTPLIFGNAAVACIEYDDPLRFRIRLMDDQSHLPPEARWNSRLWPKKNGCGS